MTLTLTDDAVAARTPARTRVAVVVPTGPTGAGLSSVLDAVAAQSLAPDRVLLVDRTADSTTDSREQLLASVRNRLGETRVDLVDAGTKPLRAAVLACARALDEDDEWLLWVLGAGVTPSATALAELHDAWRRSPSVGMVGPKLVDAIDPARLRSVGISATRAGRIVDDPADGAVDQQQYDTRHDVLAVPVIGSLVEASLVRDLGGWEDGFGDVGADLDFGWRAQRRGRRVLVQPRTRVRVAAPLGLATATTAARRRAGRRVALARASWWAAPFLALWLLVSSVLGALGLLLLKRPRAAVTLLGDLPALDPVRFVTARWRTRGPASVRRADLRGLFVPGEKVRRGLADQVHRALLPGRDQAEDAPPELRRSTTVRLLTSPGLLLALLVTAVHVVAGRTLGTGVLSGLGGGPAGGELLGGRITSAALWHAWADHWRGGGLGAATDLVGGPHLALLVLPTWVVEHLPGVGGVASPGGVVIGLLLLLGPGLAALSAYVSGRAVTASRWPRAAVGLGWAFAGPAATVYAEGRLGAAVAHVLLPAVGAGFVLLARRGGTATAAWATGLGLWVTACFAPVTLLLLLPLAVLVLAAAPTASARVRALVPLVVPLALLAPWLPAVARRPALLLAGPGVTSWSPDATPVWHRLLLSPHGVDGQWWRLLPVALIALVALAGLLRGRAVRSLSSGLAVALVVGVVGVLAASRVHLATAPDGSVVRPWSGLPMLFVLLVLLGAALLAVAPVAGEDRRLLGLRRGGAVGVALAGGAAATLLALAGLGTALVSWSDPRPAVAVDHAEGDIAGRTLFVVPDAQGVGYRVVGRELADVARSLPLDRSDDAVLAGTVAGLLDGRGETAEGLAGWSIGVVALAETADDALTRSLDSTEGLTRLVAQHGWNFWRVAAGPGTGERPVAPPRVQVVSGGDASAVPVTGIHAATESDVEATPGSALVVAEPAAWAAHHEVTMDGRALAASGPGEHPEYQLPGSGHLSIAAVDPDAGLRLAQYVLLAVTVFLAVPFGSRASRSRS